ncbi:hypothetical protein M405DRAFT_826016 [Rhizopogon salebrosus TDB-379]|nr:hypothetical protein M405DRAFT_826016 [Rhizopogon salebrosus TDB-379]
METYMTAKGQEITAIIQELSGHLLLSDVPMQSNMVTHMHMDSSPKDDNKLRRTSIRHITRVRAREIQIRTRGQLWLTR